MAILVVGGAGYIGSHVVRALQKIDRPAVVFDNLEKGHREAIPDVPLYEGDLRNKEDVRAVFENYHIDAAMHFSAYSIVGESMEKPGLYYENNLLGTLNLLTAMRNFGIKRFIFSSTAAVYGDPQNIPIDEKHQTTPTNPYGETKLAVEKMLAWFDKIFDIKSISLRYFNAAGADPQGDIGELHDPETHLIPLVLQAALGQRKQISIFGDDYTTRDGTCIRDYIHVNDLADAHILALDYLSSGNVSDVFNLRNGNGYSVKEIINVARDVTGMEIPTRIDKRRPGDPPLLIASSEKARALLDWKPKLYDIRTIVDTAWRWHSGRARGMGSLMNLPK
jgi:UDP-glucose 4-epimerase